ncbi:RNA pyrophosphohydrolase [Streptomyces sp. enrichment culture]|uniref:NUDIX hydrolase n=1 Tax=Streptomyces sp. enrichment culture TaxID=1795815 RepID=UPI003F562741
MPDQETYRHRSARVVLVDETGRVLLLKSHTDPDAPGGGHDWSTPGGGVEEGETLAEAAARELFEETGLSVAPEALGSPVAQTSGHADLGWAVGLFQDVFFHLRVTDHEVDTGGQEEHEARHHAGHRWWTVDELSGGAEAVRPLGLGDLVADLLAGRVPAEPRRLPWHH